MNEIELAKYLKDKYVDEFYEIYDTAPGLHFWPLEALILYGLIRETKPKMSFEMCCGEGRSTWVILHALLKNGNLEKFYTCDYHSQATRVENYLKDHNLLTDKIKFIYGDIKQNIDQIPLEDLDFLFIDADHTLPFGEWYCEQIIPKLKNNILVAIHDINLSGDWNNRSPGTEANALINLHNDGKLSLEKILWIEDWNINPDYKQSRQEIFSDFDAKYNKDLPNGATAFWYNRKLKQ